MNIPELKENFLAQVESHPPNSWEIEEHLENITGLQNYLQELILSQVPVIWPVSHSLCYSYLSSVKKGLECLPSDRVAQWVRDVLDIYEKEGLRAAQHFMEDVETNFLCRIRGETGLDFNDLDARLTNYARSIMERRISLATGRHIYTDTETVFLPPKFTIFKSHADNFLLYKLIVSFQLVIIKQATYEFFITADHVLVKSITASNKSKTTPERIDLKSFFSLFPDRRLAEDVFTLSEGLRASRYIAQFFPGLWRDTAKIRRDLAGSRTSPAQLPAQSGIMEELVRQVITGTSDSVSNNRQNQLTEPILAEFNKAGETVLESAEKTTAIYGLLSTLHEKYIAVPPIYYYGRLNPTEADKGILRRRNMARDEFVKSFAAVILQAGKDSLNKKQEEKSTQQKHSSLAAEDGAGTLVILTGRQKDEEAKLEQRDQARFLTLEGPQTQLPEQLRNLAEEIIADLGHIPNDYISAANGLAGQAAPPAMDAGSPSGSSLLAPLTYDEWDFRRNGFRKDWCILTEKKLQPVKGTFIDNTLVKYQGLLKNLKKQFEMLRSTERFMKRQRDGDDLDLDAIIESISDTKAGRPSSDRLFIKLQREERDIAVFFLVDMSSSTEGWVGKALKEALVLMGESLQVLGDRFAIYGFSGMRRTRCDFYQVKDFDEPYNEEIKGRIAAIGPKEYTRMGPPLRHAVELLQNVEARVRLLITLSDGKPEDYDDYKGEYAIEDTRHALIEAKASGIHPFCITIDKQAHDYISHMYGEVNYIFVDEVRKLPMRLPEIYRILTT